MLRTIIGWIRVEDELWHDTMHRMKQRMERTANMHFVQPWSIRILRHQWSFLDHASSLDQPVIAHAGDGTCRIEATCRCTCAMWCGVCV